VKQFLLEHPDMASEIEVKVRQAAGLPSNGAAPAESSAPGKDKEAASQVERAAKPPKGQKTEKHVEA
jgi:hypothetical protein